MKPIAESELVINKDGSIYHLHLHPEQIAETILIVGDRLECKKFQCILIV